MFELNIKDGESIKDYKIRLCKNKEMLNLTWDDIAQKISSILGQKVSGDTIRKFWRHYNEGYQDALRNELNGDKVLTEYENKLLEIKKEYKKIQSMNVELNKLLRERARKEIMWDQVKDAIERLPVPEFDNTYSVPKNNDRVGILAFADIHWRKIFKSLHNEYNEEIAKQRMQQLLHKTIEIVRQHGFEYIHVINGADSIEGMSLRISQLQSIQSGFIDQTISFCKFISSWLNALSSHVKIIYHHVPSANHSEVRPFNSGRGEYPAEDLEKIIMHYVHDVLDNNPRITVPIYDSDLVEINVLGYNIGALHGHQLKGKKHAIRDLSMLHRKFYDYLYVAHFHQTGSLTVGEGRTNDIEIIQIPSIMGSDNYADSLMVGAKAGAIFDVYEKGNGRIINYKIKLN